MKTVYIQRTTEDANENMDIIRGEVDLFLDGTDGSESCGMNVLADALAV